MGRIMLSKSLIQFSVDGWSCVLSLLFTWGQTVVEVMKIMPTSFKMSYARTATLSSLNPVAGHSQPKRQPETPGHSQACLHQSLVGSLLLSPGSWCAQGSVFALQSLLPQFCLSSSSSMVGSMATSSKSTYAMPRSAAPRAPALQQSTADLYLHRRQSNTFLCQSLWVLWVLV